MSYHGGCQEKDGTVIMKMSKFERKFGKYAIPNLTLILIMCYVAGYVIELVAPGLVYWLSLDPYRILHGQIWRLVSWILIPPSSFDLFTIIMLIFYYNIGTALEKTWGAYRYNVFLFSGMLLTILAAFLSMGIAYLITGGMSQAEASGLFMSGSLAFSTYYISISIYLGFAMTYPDAQVLLMFVIPVKVKWMGLLDLILMVIELITGSFFTRFAVGAALINVGLFYLSTRNLSHLAPKQMKRRADFHRDVNRSSKITRHKCAICGRTEEDDPNLEFRFCSKCNGNYEYCQYHLFTHEHVK